jgi:Mg2+/Co2+ transporter CorB
VLICLFVCFLLVRVLFIGADTMKLNKSRLKQLAQSGEVVAAPVSLKRKKVDEGS